MSNMLHNQSCQMHLSMSIHFTCGKNDTLRQNRRNCGSLFLGEITLCVMRYRVLLGFGNHSLYIHPLFLTSVFSQTMVVY
jgi:hypothetical protein